MFGSVISSLVVSAIKTTVKSSLRMDELIAKLKEACPPQQELQKIINQKNQLSQTLGLIQTNVTTINSITTNIEGVISTIDPIITVIKSIPIPSSVPPGVGVPVNLIVKLSDTLELLKDLIKQGKVSLKGAKQAFKIISDNLNKVLDKLNQLDAILTLCAAQTGFTGSISDGTSGLTSTPGVNVALNEGLENSLSPNSPNPLNYKGWRLILQTDPNNKFSFPRRRVIAQKNNPNGKGLITLTSNLGPPGSNGYSYSSDTQVLVDDIKFRIDNPNWEPESVLEEIQAIQDEAAAAAAEAARQAEEAKRGKVIFFGQTGALSNIPLGEFGGYDAGFYPFTGNIEGLRPDETSERISSVRVGRGMRITIFHSGDFLTKTRISQNDPNLQNLSRRSFENPFNSGKEYETFYVGDEFNDNVNSFIIDKLPGGTVTEFPPERLAIYESTYALKRRSKKILIDNDSNIIQAEDRFNGYVSSPPWGEPTPNLNNASIFRTPENQDPIQKAIELFPSLSRNNFILNSSEIDTFVYPSSQFGNVSYRLSSFYVAPPSPIPRLNSGREFYVEKLS